MTRPDWHDDAACNGHPTEWWFPDQGQTAHRAIAICNTCPVIDDCRREHHDEQHGVWHGRVKQFRRPRRADHISNPDRALATLAQHGRWMTAHAVQVKADIPTASIHNALSRLRARRLVDHDEIRGLWRAKRPEPAVATHSQQRS